MKRALIAVLTGLLVLSFGSPAAADHPAPPFSTACSPGSSGLHSGGESAEWEVLCTLFTGSPHTDLDYFTQGGQIYASVGALAISGTGGGQTIIQLTDENGDVSPSLVSQHPSATCPSLTTGVTGLQHDVEATPKGDVLFNTDWGGQADTRDAQLLLDATDATGRCHDNGIVGAGAPAGGLEIIDIAAIENPVEIGLTVHTGMAHTVNVDPRRPHIAYVVTSDGVGYDGETRANEVEENAAGAGQNLDGFEIVDLSSCMDLGDASVEDKRGVTDDGELLDGEGCRPEVYRYRYPVPLPGHTDIDTIFACHELEVYPNDFLACASGQFSGLFNVAGAFDDNGTPDDFTDDTINGDPLPCRVRASSSSDISSTDAPVTDCQIGQDEQDLSIPGWLDIGAPSVEGIEFRGAAFHQGRSGTTELPTFGADEDIDFSHEAELTHSGQFLLATDERGGGVVPPDSSCTPPENVSETNGGLHAYDVDEFFASTPTSPDGEPDADAFDTHARTPEGEKAIFRVTPRVPSGAFCTAHVFHQIPGQNRIFMGWYSQGTVVLDYHENADGSFEFTEAGFFIPENANTWVSAVFKYVENDDGTFTYYGATGDFLLGNVGRNAIDVYSVTLPAPPLPGESGAPGGDPGGAGTGGADGEDGGLAATGGGAALLALGAVALGAALIGRRRRGQ